MAKLYVMFVLAVLVLLVHATARNTPSDATLKDRTSNTKNVAGAAAPGGSAGVKDKKCLVGGFAAGIGGYAGVLPTLGGIGGASGLGGLGGVGGIGGVGGGVGGLGGGIGKGGGVVIP